MPYRPFHGQNRVEYMKKKFEISSPEENKITSLKTSNSTVPFKSEVLLELKRMNLNTNEKNKNVHLYTGSIFEKADVHKTDGKSLIKRTPAFRREKIECGKNVTKITSQKPGRALVDLNRSASVNKLELDRRVTEDETIGEAENLFENTWAKLQRSKTDTNLLKFSDNRNNYQTNYVRSTLISKKLNLLADSQNKSININDNDKVLPQYSMVNKNSKTNTKEDKVELKLSESIRKALQSPLPKGPPPKKPPRTFCHVLQRPSQNSIIKPTSSKLDIPKLKSKLEKLEKVIKIHEIGVCNPVSEDFKADLEKKLNKIPRTVENKPLPDVPNQKVDKQSCLSLTNCLQQCASAHTYEMLKKKSEFYLDLDKSDSELLGCSVSGIDKACFNGMQPDRISVKSRTSEPIYDLPCVLKKNYFETFGKNDGQLVLNRRKPNEGLHYMCTDVVNQGHKSPHFPADLNRRKSLDCENRIASVDSKPNFFTGMGKRISSSMSKIDGDKEEFLELANTLNVKKGSEGHKNLDNPNESLNCLIFHQSSTESDSDLMSTPSTPDFKEDEGENASRTMKVEALSQMAAKRKIYVSRVSSKLCSRASNSKCTNKSSYTHLFESCLLVGLTLCESKQNVPYIKSIFPPDVKPPPLIESLCFPDVSCWPPTSENQQPEEQYYSLVITNENGERKFGYCRRVLPEGGHFCLPLTYCIISPHRANGFFYKVLQELESRHGSPGIENFIKQLYESQFPGPGERLKLKEILEEATRTSPLSTPEYFSSTLVRRPCDLRLEEKDLTQLLEQLKISVFLKVFSSLLHERKVLLLSNSLRKLSSCIEALQSILLPFSWQHTYIPVLPVHLIEMCDAPTPYVIGLLKPKNVEEPLANVNFENGIVVDLDDSKIFKCCGDEGTILPPRFVKDLKTSLTLAVNATDLSDSTRNVLISDAFIRFFVQVCGNYSTFVLNLSNGQKIFEKEDFIKSVASNTTRSFLEWFTETAMFNSFIQERLHGDVEDAQVKLFRLRAMEYLVETMESAAVLPKNYKVINRKVRTLGYKIKDFTSFTK